MSKRKPQRYEDDEEKGRPAKKDRCPEDLKLGRRILVRLLADKRCTASFSTVTEPEKMADARGQIIRQFVLDQCAREPMATFARLCLDNQPSAPNEEAKVRVGRLKPADFRQLWRRIDHVFSPLAEFAGIVVKSMFLRGAALLPRSLAPDWDVGADLDKCAPSLSCDEVIRVFEASRAGVRLSSFTLAGIAMRERKPSEWLEPGNEHATRVLANLIKTGLGPHYIGLTPDPEIFAHINRTHKGLFDVLVRRSPAIAEAVASIAPPEWIRAGLELIFEPKVAEAIGSRLARKARPLYVRKIGEASIFPPGVAGIVATYCV